MLEANVRIARATEEVSQRLEDAEETANRLCEGMSDLYELMAGQAFAYPGGEQCGRVIPEALEFVRSRAAAMSEGEE